MFYQLEHIGVPEYLKVENNINFSFPPHIHQCFEIILLRKGTMTVTIADKKYTLKEKEAVIVFPNQIHSLDSLESEHTLCIFAPEIVKLFSVKYAEKLPENNKFYFNDTLIRLFEQLTENTSKMFKKGVLYLICDEFDKHTTYKTKESDKKYLLYSIFVFVDRNFSKNCSLSVLSGQLGYNYSYLSRYFRKIVGISFNAYVKNYRLNHACYLLKNTKASIMQCALDSGFETIRSFNRDFKQYFEITPNEYRNMTIS